MILMDGFSGGMVCMICMICKYNIYRRRKVLFFLSLVQFPENKSRPPRAWKSNKNELKPEKAEGGEKRGYVPKRRLIITKLLSSIIISHSVHMRYCMYSTYMA